MVRTNLPQLVGALLGLTSPALFGCMPDAASARGDSESGLAAFSVASNQQVAQDPKAAFAAAVQGGYITQDCQPKVAQGMALAMSIGYGAASDTSDASVEAGVGYGAIEPDALGRLVYNQQGSDGSNAAIPPGGDLQGITRWGMVDTFTTMCQVAFSIRNDGKLDYSQVRAMIGSVQGTLGNVQTNLSDALIVKASDGSQATATFVFQKGFGLIGWDYSTQSTVGGTARVMLSPNGSSSARGRSGSDAANDGYGLAASRY